MPNFNKNFPFFQHSIIVFLQSSKSSLKLEQRQSMHRSSGLSTSDGRTLFCTSVCNTKSAPTKLKWNENFAKTSKNVQENNMKQWNEWIYSNIVNRKLIISNKINEIVHHSKALFLHFCSSKFLVWIFRFWPLRIIKGEIAVSFKILP